MATLDRPRYLFCGERCWWGWIGWVRHVSFQILPARLRDLNCIMDLQSGTLRRRACLLRIEPENAVDVSCKNVEA